MSPTRVPADDELVGRNFQILGHQAEWLRVHAHSERASQAELVREAIDDLIVKRVNAIPPGER